MKQAYTIVTNLLTGEEFPMPYNAEEAIKRAYAIECNELDKYIKGEKDYAIQYGKAFVSCGDFTAKIEYTDSILENMWEELTDIPFSEIDGELFLEENWLHFKKGTEREDIWKWFDSHHSKGVYYLLYEFDELGE